MALLNDLTGSEKCGLVEFGHRACRDGRLE
jgi:hypothetical protein